MTTLSIEDGSRQLQAKLAARSQEMRASGKHILRGGGKYPARSHIPVTITGAMIPAYLEFIDYMKLDQIRAGIEAEHFDEFIRFMKARGGDSYCKDAAYCVAEASKIQWQYTVKPR